MLKRPAALLASAALLATLAAGCNRGSDAKPKIEPRDAELDLKLTTVLRGDLEFDVTRTVRTKVIVMAPSESSSSSLLGVEPVDLIEAGDSKAKAGFALIPFRGDGRYEIRPGSAEDTVKEQEVAQRTGTPRERSSIRVEFWAPNREPESFLRRAEPCTAEIKDGGLRGRLHCPRITAEGTDPRRFSLELRWEPL
ncbi:MAG TPA: hypothetical protein VM938_11770 [Acidimicrobiales bacterium]|nr:hypothetical protein [Acidimicrobiales bacterium]